MPFLHDDETHHRTRNLPAAHYTDLSSADIALLTAILNHAPSSSKSILTSSYETIVRAQIATLPPHLLSKLPWLSTFCTLHHKIIPLPVKSLLKALRHEIDVAAEAVWTPLRERGALNAEQKHLLATLEDLSSLWLSQDAFEAKCQRPPPSELASRTGAKCAACTLACIGGHREGMIALGAFFIGRTAPRIWKKSKRILWMEAWIRGSLDEEVEEVAVREMWRVGSALRKVRKECEGKGREVVDRAVGQAGAPQSVQTESGWHDELTANEVFGVPANPFEYDDGEQERLVELRGQFRGDMRLPYAASSIYSRSPEDGRLFGHAGH